MGVPSHPKIYHITHVKNLPSIIESEVLWSDAEMLGRNIGHQNIGMPGVKRNRMNRPVKCHAGTLVGEYVPFYFCPRSVMLFLLHKGNRPGVTYTEGQKPLLHLQGDIRKVVEWAETNHTLWAFTNINAAAKYAEFYNRLDDLGSVDWNAVESRNFSDPEVKERKQAEFLLYGSFPWQLIEEIGVCDETVHKQVAEALEWSSHKPRVKVRPKWYY